jgi:hypothetical protein
MNCRPIVLPPRCCVHNCYVTRRVPYIQPIVNVNRVNVMNVPELQYRQINRTVIVDPGCPTQPVRGRAGYPY